MENKINEIITNSPKRESNLGMIPRIEGIWVCYIKQKEAQKVGNFLDTSTQTDKKVAYENLIGII